MFRPLQRFKIYAFSRLCLQTLLSSAFALLVAGSVSDLSVAQIQQQGAAESESSEEEDMSEEGKEKVAELKPKQVRIGGIFWYVDYDAALKIAQKENKPIWLHFGENPG